MSRTATLGHPERKQSVAQALRQLGERPPWLLAALDPAQVRQALERHVPEFASGELRIAGCGPLRLFLKDKTARWRGTFNLSVAGLPGEAPKEVRLAATLSAPWVPGLGEEAAPATRFGDDGWQVYLPEVRLHCAVEPPEQELEILPQLTDPAMSRALLEQAIAAGASTYRGLRIAACRPEVLNYKPGSRCTLLYHLEYLAADADRGWPPTAIAKTYRGRKGEQAFVGMAALWNTPLSSSAAVRIAEPLAYVHEWKLLVQTSLAEEQTLEQLVRAALAQRAPETRARLERFVRAAATGLAELHLSGARTEGAVTWDERSATIPEALERIAVVAPDLAAAAQPLFDDLLAQAATHAPDPLVPSHGSFDSDQVLIAGETISFIDFDSFCMAEPSMDVGHFRAAIMDSGMKVIDAQTLHDPAACQAYLDDLNALGELFLAQYEALAPISRQRLAVWEGWDYLRDALHLWTKPKIEGAQGVVRILDYHLATHGQ